MIGIYGKGGAIPQALLPLLPKGEEVVDLRHDGMRFGCDRYLFAGGYLAGAKVGQQRDGALSMAWTANFVDVVAVLEPLWECNPTARVVVIGSESATTGSFDMAYAGAKAAMHLYVETKRLPHPGQQLVCIAPGIISDAGMTTRRTDTDRLKARADAHPKRRFCRAEEVARLAKFLLYDDGGYITGTTIRMNGGEHTCR